MRSRISYPISHASTARTPIPDDDLDRGIPQKIAGVVYGTALGVLFGLPLGFMLGFRWVWLFLFAAVAGLVIGAFVKRFATGVADGAAHALLRMVWPSGDTTPYARTYSREQALAAKGNLAEALDAYEDAIAMNPDDPEPRIQAAELHFRGSSPGRAAELFLDARRVAAADRARELYATQRLIDLYFGPLQSPGKARVELRRLADRFPGTREGEAAANCWRS